MEDKSRFVYYLVKNSSIKGAPVILLQRRSDNTYNVYRCSIVLKKLGQIMAWLFVNIIVPLSQLSYTNQMFVTFNN